MRNSIKIDWRIHNPLYWHIKRYMNDESIRFILLLGGSSSGKSYSTTQAICLDTIESGDNTMVMRKYGVDLKDSIYSDFKGFSSKLNTISDITAIQNEVRINNGIIRFRGLDKSESIKGIARFKRVYLDELTDFLKNDLDQIRKRLRGRKGQQIIASWNPISPKHWVKTQFTDNEDFERLDNSLTGKEFSKYIGGEPSESWLKKYTVLEENHSYRKINKSGDMVIIKTTHRDNFWVVGHPAGEGYGFNDKHTLNDYERDRINNPVNYKIYANGEYGTETEGLYFIEGKHYEIVDSVPEHARKVPYGLDFGFDPDPASINEHYYADNSIIIDEKLYHNGYVNVADSPYIPNLYDFFNSLKGYNKTDLIIADSAEKKSIMELKIKGLNIMKCRKGSGSILEGINQMKSMPMRITTRSKNTIIEYENYKRLYDKSTGLWLPQPDKRCADHSIDNTRYVVTQKGFLW